ncbi:MAG: HAD hydrolase-like protein [Fermentimonas sp.]|nr:HAD hydrolase-like protein [Fermentimonas sp.]
MRQQFENYLRKHNYTNFDLQAVLFDMDGVLYDSMPAHAKSWQETMEEFGYKSTKPVEFYLHEGRVGKSTINLITEREFKRSATKEEKDNIYARKTELFQQINDNATLPGAKEVLSFVKKQGLKPILVTGSGQPSLLDRLDTHFPDVFTPETMVTAYDVIKGKPDAEPYLMGLEKGGMLSPNQAIVIENAPLGIESASAAGIFTIAVNTGLLSDEKLIEAGASLLLHSMTELLQKLPEIIQLSRTMRI